MKTNLFLLGMAAAALVGCTKNEVTDISNSKAIGFETFVNNSTKTVEGDAGTTNTNLSEFYVYGGSDKSQNLFNGERVYKGTDWQYDNIKYWVEGSTYKFAAIYPGAGSNLSANFDYGTGHMELLATVDNANQYDLVYAEQGPITINADNIASQPKVSFTLGHILSKLRFVFQKNADFGNNTQLIISNLKVSGANTMEGQGIWSKATYANTSGNFTWTRAEDASNVTFTSDQTYTVTDESIVGSATEEKEVGQTFFVIPQTPSQGFTLSFTVQLQEKATLSTGEAWVNIGKPHDLEATINNAQWAANNVYTYTIKLKQGNITSAYPIEFAASVSGWGSSAGGGDIEL